MTNYDINVLTDDEIRTLLGTCDGSGKPAKTLVLNALLAERKTLKARLEELAQLVMDIEEQLDQFGSGL